MSETNPKPLVSVIMNCYNGAEFLKESIDSVINQTYLNWELIFWDNQSTDNSAEILFSYNDSRIKYFYAPEHTKLYAARNLAIEKAEGEYIAFLDTDDTWMPEKLDCQLKCLIGSEYALACSNYFLINSKSMKLKKAFLLNKKSGYIIQDLVKDYYIGILTVLVSRKILRDLSLEFNENYNIVGDFDLFLKISESNQIHYENKVLACYRIHGNNLSSKKELELVREIGSMIREFNNRILYLDNPVLLKKLKALKNYLLIKTALRKNKSITLTNIVLLFFEDFLKFFKLIIIFFTRKV